MGSMLLAATLAGSIISIADGDTPTARSEMSTGAQDVEVRLAEINGPEKIQALRVRAGS